MKKINLLFLALIIAPFMGLAQSESTNPQFIDYGDPSAMGTTRLTIYLPDGNKYIKESVVGTPYLDEEWQDGRINLKEDKDVDKFKLRYNAYNDQIEFNNKGQAWVLTKLEKVENVLIDEKVFIYADFKDKKEDKKGFFEPVYQGEGVQVLRKYQCRYLEATYNSTLAAGTQNAKFSHDEALFIKKKGEPAVIFNGSKGKLYKILGDNKTEMSTYLKSQKLNVKNQADLVKAVAYYESL